MDQSPALSPQRYSGVDVPATEAVRVWQLRTFPQAKRLKKALLLRFKRPPEFFFRSQLLGPSGLSATTAGRLESFFGLSFDFTN